ncbi:MAG: amidinotransferase [Bacteroidetes bacterium B1(2017)]|nr:MAG: amidinotransferase [Bacteroidetes bacterium B1(2017)]
MTSAENFKVYTTGKLPFTINDLKRREEPLQVLMCSPEYFDIIDVKNVHMEGMAQQLNKELALKQWSDLKFVYAQLLDQGLIEGLKIILGVKGCEDMVFCANQTFPWMGPNQKREVWMSRMRHPSRQREVPFFENYFLEMGYQPRHFAKTPLFEGMGDTIPHPGKLLLYGGYGHRSNKTAYEELSEQLSVPVIALELINENFYHLDTCFVPLSETQVMLCKEAFTEEGLALIHQCFEEVLEIPMEEAIATFCLNAHVVNNQKTNKKAAILQLGSVAAKAALNKCGYTIFEVETSEYMKSGGSVFCMKMMFF